MKRKLFCISFALILVLALTLVPAIPAGAVSYDSTLELENKDPNTWVIIEGDGTYAMLDFNSMGPEFEYSLQAWGLESNTEYALIYYGDQPDPFVNWGGDNPGGIIGTFTTDGSGNIPATAGSVELNMSLPCDPDINTDGAKIWLTPTNLLTGGNALPMIVWQPTRILFEHNLVEYTDTGSTTNLTVVVPDIVAISADPGSIDFGTMLPGDTSSIYVITIENIGTHAVHVHASVTGTSAMIAANLWLRQADDSPTWAQGTPWTNIIMNLVMDATEDLETYLTVPGGYTPLGPEGATLLFEAEAL